VKILRILKSLAVPMLVAASLACQSETLSAQATDPDTSNLPVLKAMPLYYTQDSHAWLPDSVDLNPYSAYFWFNANTHQFAYWSMGVRERSDPPGSYNFGRTAWQTFSITPGYVVGAIGDFNGDELSDLVWTSPAHDLYLWTKTLGQTGYASSYIGTYPTGWRLIGAGDVNGDGMADLVWQNTQTCQFGYWIMQGSKVVRTKAIDVSCGYRVAAIADVNDNGFLDIIWTSDKSDLYVWYGDGSGFRSVFAGNYPAGSQLVAVGNLDGGHKTSLVNGQAKRLDRFNLMTLDGSGGLSLLEWVSNAPWPNVTSGVVSPITYLGRIDATDYLGPLAYSGRGMTHAGFVLLNDSSVNATTGTPIVFEKAGNDLNGYWISELSNYAPDQKIPYGVNPPVVTYPSGWKMVGKSAQ